jgi:hypothetical protein
LVTQVSLWLLFSIPLQKGEKKYGVCGNRTQRRFFRQMVLMDAGQEGEIIVGVAISWRRPGE